MATIKEMTKREMASWGAFLASLTAETRKIAEAHPPWLLYRHGPTGERVLISAYSDDGTVRMIVSSRYNLTLFEREVFGVPATDLTECDLPSPEEPVGVILKTQEEIDEHIAEFRAEHLRRRH